MHNGHESQIDMRFISYKLFTTALLISLTVSNVFAVIIYVSPKGNDHNPGTINSPLATIAAARDKVRSIPQAQRNAEPVYVMIEQGDYFLNELLVFSPEDSGTETAPVIYRAKGKIKPVINGGKVLPRFEQVSPKLWKVFIPDVAKNNWVFEQLFINGKRATRAQSPAYGSFYKIKGVTETVIMPGQNNAGPVQAEQQLLLNINESGWRKTLSASEIDGVVVTIYHAWDITRRKIKSLSDSSISMVGEGMRPWNKFNSKSIFTLENAKSFLDQEGEWFLEGSGTLYYIPRQGETPENTIAIAPLYEELLKIAGDESNQVHHIRFENLAFQFTGYILPATGYEPEQASASAKAAVTVNDANHINFTNCEIKHTANYGLWFRNGCSNSMVKQCYFKDLGAGGIKIGETKIPVNDRQVTNHIVIDNNIIVSGGHVFPTGVGIIIFHAGDNVITHNDISDLKYTGISAGWVWGYTPSYAKNNNISYNHIHHLGWGILSDMGGVYLLGIAPGTRVENNVIHHIYSYDYGGWGLYTDEGSTGVILQNNLVYACKSSAFHQHYGKENVIKNNVFVSQVKAQLEATRVENHLSFSFKNNIIYTDKGNMTGNAWTTVHFFADSNSYWDIRTKDIRFGNQSFDQWRLSGKDKNSIIADPRFKNPEKYNFKIANKALLSQIGFQPFNDKEAGVYGSKKWKKLAHTETNINALFDEKSRKNEFKAD